MVGWWTVDGQAILQQLVTGNYWHTIGNYYQMVKDFFHPQYVSYFNVVYDQKRILGRVWKWDQKNKWELYSWDFGGIRTLFLDEPYVRMFFFTFCMAMLWYTEQPQFETVTKYLFGARFLALRRPRFVFFAAGQPGWNGVRNMVFIVHSSKVWCSCLNNY